VGIAGVDVAFAAKAAAPASNPIAQKMTNEPGFIDLPHLGLEAMLASAVFEPVWRTS
jgi:hypothetical protein